MSYDRVWTSITGSLNINAAASDVTSTITSSTVLYTPAIVKGIDINCATASSASVKVVNSDGDIIASAATPLSAIASHGQTCFSVIPDSDQLPLTIQVAKPAGGSGGVNGIVRVRVSGIYASGNTG